MSDPALRRLVRSGRLIELQRGVYAAASTAPSPRLVLAGVMAAAGADAVVTHRAAAWLRGWMDIAPAPEITVPHGRSPTLRAVVIHRSRRMPAAVRVRGLACSEPHSTLIECATVCTAREMAGLLDRALAARHVSLPGVLRALDRLSGPGRRGPDRLRRVLEDRGMVGGPSPSVLESRAARLMRRAGVPDPKAEVTWGPEREYRLDFVPAARLVVEVDGYAWHSSPEQLQRDHARRNTLMRAGWTVLVYTWLDVTREPERVGAEILAAYCAATRRRGGRALPA